MCSFIFTMVSANGCKVPNRFFCDSTTPCTLAERPYCDLVREECETTAWDGFEPTDLSFRNDGMVECSDSTSCTSESKPICDARSTCVGCSDDLQCKGKNAATGRCNTVSGSCVACLADPNSQQSSDCSAATPICDGVSNMCRACKANSDCTSLVCNLDGTCADSSTIAYVDNANGACSGSHSGAQADPICDLSMGIAVGKAIVRVAGSSVAYSKLTISSGTVTIIGPGQKGVSSPAKITGDLSNPAVTISGASTVITFDGIEVTGGGAAQDGIYCSQASVGPTLTVRRSYVHDVSGVGVDVGKCRVTLEQNQIGPGCVGGAISLGGAQYSIVNNFIVGNNTTSAAVAFGSGSASLTGQPGFRYNTVAGNGAVSTTGGLSCTAGLPSVIEASIVTGNSKTGLGSLATQFVGNCTFTYVNTDDATLPAGTGNTSAIPDVVNATPTTPDFHLTGRTTNNNACCIDKISTSVVLVDYDGRVRPQPIAGSFDIGAHEVP